MTFFNYPGVPTSNGTFSQPAGPGLQHTPEYMASGLPFVSSSTLSTTPIKIEFPYVTKTLNLRATAGSFRVGFTQVGVNGTNYFVVDTSSVKLDIRCKTIFVRSTTGAADMTLCAELTTIDRDRMPLLTGSYADPITGKCQFLTGSTEYSFGYNGIG
jgi:hypothetical protein